MRKRALLFGAGLMVAGNMLVAAPAMAQTTVCAGTSSTVYVCSNPTGGTVLTDCVYVGPPPCMPVTVPGPTLSCGGALIPYIRCQLF